MQVRGPRVARGDSIVRRRVGVRVVHARVAPVRPGIGREEHRTGQWNELDGAREDEDVSEPRSSAPHEIERAEIHRERRREERQKEARSGCEVAAGKRHDRRPCARLDDNERDDQRERQYARGERATGLGQGRVVAPLSSSVAEAAAPEAVGGWTGGVAIVV